MSLKRLTFGFLVILALGQTAYGLKSWFDPNVYVIFCDVGQGDATLVTRGQVQILIDGGPNDQVQECLSKHVPWFDRQLELVVNTHPQQDHLGGLPEVLARYQVGLYLTGPASNPINSWRKLTDTIYKGKIEVYIPKAGDRLNVGGIELMVLWPEADAIEGTKTGYQTDLSLLPTSDEDLNQLSVVLHLRYKSFNLLLPGDLDGKGELALSLSPLLTDVDVLKVSHHGSKFASTADFLARISPSVAVIEVGRNNSFGHPTLETLIRLEAVGARVLRTDVDGEVRLSTDGTDFWLW